MRDWRTGHLGEPDTRGNDAACGVFLEPGEPAVGMAAAYRVGDIAIRNGVTQCALTHAHGLTGGPIERGLLQEAMRRALAAMASGGRELK